MGEDSRLPKVVYVIIGSEFCERFCYYGMRSAVLGDAFLGRFKTIAILSVVYFTGITMLSLCALPPLGPPLLTCSFVSLFLITLGTGGIKPCVSTFGADQIQSRDGKHITSSESSASQIIVPLVHVGKMGPTGQTLHFFIIISIIITVSLVHHRQHGYFALFYLSINLGSLLSSIISPVLRADVTCFGQDCYGLAFGLMAVLMLIAIVVFLLGYKQYKKIPADADMAKNFFGCIYIALKRLLRREKYEKNWLELSSGFYDEKHIENVRKVLNIFFLFMPLPVFWALFDQMGSTWTLQALEMDGNMAGIYTVKPDQMQAWNSFLILIFVPFFEMFIYPSLSKVNIMTKPLDRMFCGIVFASAAFFSAGFLQMYIQKSSSRILQTNLTIVNACPVKVNFNYDNHSIELNHGQVIALKINDCNKHVISLSNGARIDINKPEAPGSYIIYGNSNSLSYTKLKYEQNVSAYNRKARIRFVKIGSNTVEFIQLIDKRMNYLFHLSDKSNATSYEIVEPGIYEIVESGWKIPKLLQLRNGAVYSALIVIGDKFSEVVDVILIEESSVKFINMHWQLIQYVFITIAEVLFAITGIQFAYSQAPESMKSLVTSGWLLTVAFGNLIVIIVAHAHAFHSQVIQFFFFGCATMVTGSVFYFLSYSYKYSVS